MGAGEVLRNFQLHRVDSGTSATTLNATLSGLRFFFGITLGRVELMASVTTHTLRHPSATHLLAREVDIRVIQVLLGHMAGDHIDLRPPRLSSPHR